jgi:hypothetical protein
MNFSIRLKINVHLSLVMEPFTVLLDSSDDTEEQTNETDLDRKRQLSIKLMMMLSRLIILEARC